MISLIFGGQMTVETVPASLQQVCCNKLRQVCRKYTFRMQIFSLAHCFLNTSGTLLPHTSAAQFAASAQQVYFSYAIFFSGTQFAATLRHTPAAYFSHTCKCAASILSYAIFFSGTQFAATLRHTPAAYFLRTICGKCAASILFVCKFFFWHIFRRNFAAHSCCILLAYSLQ